MNMQYISRSIPSRKIIQKISLLEKVVKNYEVAKVVKDIFQILSWFYSVK